LQDNLAWCAHAETIRKPAKYRAPSWSSASIDATLSWIAFGVRGKDDLFALVDYELVPEGSDPFRQVIGGWIRVRALFRRIDCVVTRPERRVIVCPIDEWGHQQSKGEVTITLDVFYPPTPDENILFGRTGKGLSYVHCA
jgi:hypothetical protein